MHHLGDITKINGAEIEPVDIITGGSPCQDLSCAGLRAGLAGERSGLFMEQIRIIKEMRDADVLRGRTGEFIRPRYCIWENVPGALSSNGGADFQAVLSVFIRVADPEAPDVPLPAKGKWNKWGGYMGEGPNGRWSVAFRIHDAQYYGVPQRRRRICVIADYAGWTAHRILFDPQYRRETAQTDPEQTESDSGEEPGPEVQPLGENLHGNFEPSGAAREETAGCLGESAEGAISFQERAGKPGGARESSFSMSAQEPCPRKQTKASSAVCLEGNGSRESHRGDGWKESDQMYTLNTTEQHAVAYGISPFESNAMKSSNPYSGVYEADTSRTLDLNGGSPACNQGGIAIVEPTVYNGEVITITQSAGFKQGNGANARGIGYQEETSPSLTSAQSGTNQTPVVFVTEHGNDSTDL